MTFRSGGFQKLIGCVTGTVTWGRESKYVGNLRDVTSFMDGPKERKKGKYPSHGEAAAVAVERDCDLHPAGRTTSQRRDLVISQLTIPL